MQKQFWQLLNSIKKIKSLHVQKKSKLSAWQKKKDIQQLIYSRQYAPKNFPRGLSPNSAAWRARTVPGGGKEHSVWTAALLRLLSLPSSHTVCVTVCVLRCRKVSPTLPSSLLSSLTCFGHLLSQTNTLRHGCATQNLQMAHALRISPQIPLFFFQSPATKKQGIWV